MAENLNTPTAPRFHWPDPATLEGFAREVVELLSSVDEPRALLEGTIERFMTQLRAIEALMNLLDAISPDPELEPSLGWTSGQAACGRYPSNSASDLEQPLGWTEPEARSGRYVPDPEEREPDADCEPSLGSCSANLCQSMWSMGNSDEREEVCEDEAAQCEDEGAEHDGREPEEDCGATQDEPIFGYNSGKGDLGRAREEAGAALNALRARLGPPPVFSHANVTLPGGEPFRPYQTADGIWVIGVAN